MFYEHHKFADSALKIYFERQTRTQYEPPFEMHWHSTLELIYLIEGKLKVQLDMETMEVSEGNIIAINPQCTHRFAAVGKECTYYCLIPDNSIILSAGLMPEGIAFKSVVKDSKLIELYQNIITEMSERKPYYKTIVISLILNLVGGISRISENNKNIKDLSVSNPRLGLVKSAISYLDTNFQNEITIDRMCLDIGVSKSYLCHIFREITGLTMTENLNYIRCRNARLMMQNEGVSVQTAAYKCGFNSTAYFCKIYKKLMGTTPSKYKVQL